MCEVDAAERRLQIGKRPERSAPHAVLMWPVAEVASIISMNMPDLLRGVVLVRTACACNAVGRAPGPVSGALSSARTLRHSAAVLAAPTGGIEGHHCAARVNRADKTPPDSRASLFSC